MDLLTVSACDTAMGSSGATGTEVEGFAVGPAEGGQGCGGQPVARGGHQYASTDADLLPAAGEPGWYAEEALRQAQLALLRGQGAPPPGPQVAALSGSLAGRSVRPTARLDLEPYAAGFCGDVAMQPRFVPSPQAPYAHPYYWAPFILIGNWK